MKILYYVDYLQNVPNSVGDMLNRILEENGKLNCEQIVAGGGYLYNLIDISTINRVKTYSAVPKSLKTILLGKEYGFADTIYCLFFRILRTILGRIHIGCGKIDTYSSNAYLNKVIKTEKPDIIVFFVFTPKERYTEICKKHNIRYLYLLYDTFVSRPGITDKQRSEEKYCIKNSVGYFVPSFFYEDYKDYYNSENVYGFNLPLLIEKEEVVNAYKRNIGIKYQFSYFGQIQTFRQADKIKDLLRKAGIILDVFTTMDYDSDDVFRVHSAVSGKELNNILVSSNYLIAFDNSIPYDRYLPSKAYLYVSFTKPVIAFGDNKDSALIKFFSGYPMFYYQNINEPIDGLVDFIKKTKCNQFIPELYNNYLEYLPNNALSNLRTVIERIE